jgi:organic radical activating enzyme
MANIVEVFSGIQGEGTIVGYRQLFVRFANCQLDCGYCDTDFAEKQYANIEIEPGKRNFIQWKNPVDYNLLAEHLISMNRQLKHHSVSLTGGEPLLNSKYLSKLLPILRSEGMKIYLETNGLLYSYLSDIVKYVDIIGMDIKLKSATNQITNWLEHEKFLTVAKDKELFVKVVVSNKTTENEIKHIAELLEKLETNAPLILQPITPKRGFQPPAPDQLLQLMEIAINCNSDVRIIPQTHIMLQQL